MSKPKDHLFELDDVARSVLLGHTVKAVCGEERVLTREDLDAEYFGTCKRCLAGASDDSARDGIPFQVNPKNGWLRVIERAWVARFEDEQRERSFRPPVWNLPANVTTYKWTSPKPKGGPADAH